MFDDPSQSQEQHDMELEKTHPSGAEEWYCPTCGYRFVMTWPPEFKRVILNVGNPFAVHNGGKGGVHMDTPQLDDQEPILSDELRAELVDLLDNIDFDD